MTSGITEWFAGEILQKVARAEVQAVHDTIAAAVALAKSDHGWQNRTGAAQMSIKEVPPTAADVRRGALGAFGFAPIDIIGPVRPRRSRKSGRLRKAKHWDMHGLFLEIGFRGKPGDHTIRRAGDREFPKLADRIAKRLNGR